tara:strand:+ start:1771 stop:2910 length:1140 start_codon:yes stop_codon:yes gene_type:complete
MIKTGSDFSGVGAFDQALRRLNINYKTIFACDWDKYARQTYIENYGEPDYFPENVYDRKIPYEPLDIYMTSPPCQAFSLAGNRKGEDDKRGVLFYNSHEFIKINKPRYFIFENVKGLLSDDKGRTFQRWLDYLGKSINGNPILFPHPESVNYHIYFKVLNSKDFGVPQNRERVFIIGIRDDKDNYFRFPKEEHLKLKLKDILESEVDDKYYLSESAVNSIINNKDNIQKSKVNPSIANALQSPGNACGVYKGGSGHLTKEDGTSYCVDTGNSQAVEIKENLKDGTALHNLYNGFNEDIRTFENFAPTIRTAKGGGHIPSVYTNSKIRRLTPTECFRLQDFPESFKWTCSDSQAYKQAGNSITVGVLAKIVEKLNIKKNT